MHSLSFSFLTLDQPGAPQYSLSTAAVAEANPTLV